MSDRDVEIELALLRGEARGPSDAEPVPTEQALELRARGNLPDDRGRSLRLVLSTEEGDPLERRRLRYEPDFHSAPMWRVPGSRPVTIIPLGTSARTPRPEDWTWTDDERMAALESEWVRTGSIEGIAIPAEHRGFLFKTIVSLREAGREVTVDSLCGSIARWLSQEDVELIREALLTADRRRFA